MPRISNYHGHIYLCRHATGTIEEYVQRAIDTNLEEIGISDHIPYEDELCVLLNSRRMSVDEFYNVYLPELNRIKEVYKDQITLLRAAEIEYYDQYASYLPKIRSLVDYLVLGQHEIYANNAYKSVYSRDFNQSDLVVYKDMVIKALETGCFKILAHPDLFMFRYNPFDSVCAQISKEIIEACDKNNVYMEINANGIRRCIVKGIDYLDEDNYQYPYPDFWDLVHDYQKDHPSLKVIINDDCHEVSALNDSATLAAYKFAENHKIVITDKIDF